MLTIKRNIYHLFVVLAVVSLLGLGSNSPDSINFDCQVSGNNDGCHKTVNALRGKKIVGAVAACNLEYGTISRSQLATVPANTIKVFRKSDFRLRYPTGNCYVGSNSLIRGQKTISGIYGRNSVRIGCQEHDKNGGDCHIKGVLYMEEGRGTDEDGGNPPPPPQQGYSQLAVSNCHNNRRTVYLWTRDITAGAPWIQRGSLSAQWSSGSCPIGSPFVISLTDGHLFDFTAIDPDLTGCGGRNDPQYGACQRFKFTQAIRGDTDAPTLPVRVN